MNWLLPGFLAAGLLTGLPILLHLLRKKPVERIPFPSLRFVTPSVLETRKLSQIMRWIVLALRCAIILGLAFAFARPFWSEPINPSSRAVVIAVDNSFSMQAGERWNTLRTWAENQLGNIAQGDRGGVLLMHPSPTWLVPLTDNIDAVKDAFHNLQPGFEGTHYRPPLILASEALAQAPVSHRSLIWMGDEQRAGWQDVDFSQPLSAGVTLAFPPAQKAPARQAAITAVVCHASSIEVHIRQFAPAHDKRTLSVFANGQLVSKQPVELDSHKQLSLPIAVTPGTEWMQVSLDSDDCPADDSGYAVTNPNAALSVILPAAREPDFLQQALAASHQNNLLALRSLPPSDTAWPMDSVAVLRGKEVFSPPLLDRLNAFVNAGGAAWVILDGSREQIAWLKARGITATESHARRHLRGLDMEHPVFAAFADSSLMPLLDPEFANGFNLGGEGLAPLAQWTDQSTAIAESGHLVITGFDLSRAASPLPLSPAFVPLVHQTIAFLGQAGDQQSGDYRVGRPIELPKQPGTWTAVASPRPQEPLAVNGSVTPTQPGIYRFEPGMQEKTGKAPTANATPAPGNTHLYAVGVPEEESDLTPWPDDRWKQLENRAPAPPPTVKASVDIHASSQKSNIWWWLILMAAVLLTLETLAANRTAL